MRTNNFLYFTDIRSPDMRRDMLSYVSQTLRERRCLTIDCIPNRSVYFAGAVSVIQLHKTHFSACKQNHRNVSQVRSFEQTQNTNHQANSRTCCVVSSDRANCSARRRSSVCRFVVVVFVYSSSSSVCMSTKPSRGVSKRQNRDACMCIGYLPTSSSRATRTRATARRRRSRLSTQSQYRISQLHRNSIGFGENRIVERVRLRFHCCSAP